MEKPFEAASLSSFYRALFSDIPEQELLRMGVTIFKAYLDESGIDKTDVCAVAGFMGGIPALDGLAKDWQKVLDRFKVPDFHAVRFTPHPTKSPNQRRTHIVDGATRSVSCL